MQVLELSRMPLARGVVSIGDFKEQQVAVSFPTPFNTSRALYRELTDSTRLSFHGYCKRMEPCLKRKNCRKKRLFTCCYLHCSVNGFLGWVMYIVRI